MPRLTSSAQQWRRSIQPVTYEDMDMRGTSVVTGIEHL